MSPGALAAGATCAAALGVPLLFVRALEAPFVVPKLALLELTALAGFLALGLHLRRGGGPALARPVALGAALVLASTAAAWLVAAAGPAGAPHAGAAFARWVALFGLAAGAAVLAADPARRRALPETVVAAAAAVSAIGLWQHLDLTPLPIPVISAPGATFGNRNLAAELVAMSLPFALALLAGARRARRPPAVRAALLAGLALQLAYLGATRARGAWLGALAGLLTWLLLARPQLSRRAAALGLLGALAAAAAAIVPGALNPQHVHDEKRFGSALAVARASLDPQSVALRSRLGLWTRTLAMWQAHPVWGVGPGNWPVFFPRHAEPGATADQVLTPSLAPRQAHDDLLERAAETGLVGLAALLALAAGAVVSTRRRLRSPEPEVRASTAAAAAALAALAGAGLTGFPLEMPATLALAGLALGLVGAATPGANPSTARAGSDVPALAPPAYPGTPSLLGPAVLVLGALLVPIAVLRAERQVRGSYELGRAERALRGGAPAEAAARALPHLERARAATPAGFRIELRLALALLRQDRPAEAAAAARRALAVEPWSPNAWTMLAVAQLAAREPSAARDSARRALALLADYPLALATEARAAEALGARAEAETAWRRLQMLIDPAVAGSDTAGSARELLQEREREKR